MDREASIFLEFNFQKNHIKSFRKLTLKVVPLGYPRTVCTHSSCVRYFKENNNCITEIEYITHCHRRWYLRGRTQHTINIWSSWPSALFSVVASLLPYLKSMQNLKKLTLDDIENLVQHRTHCPSMGNNCGIIWLLQLRPNLEWCNIMSFIASNYSCLNHQNTRNKAEYWNGFGTMFLGITDRHKNDRKNCSFNSFLNCFTFCLKKFFSMWENFPFFRISTVYEIFFPLDD